MKKKVLIVDDETPIREIYETKFSLSDYDVTSATNGDEAIKKVGSFRPDLIILDLLMPVIDGFGVLQFLREKKINVPVIVISNLDQESEREKSFRFGIMDYFVKAHVTPAEVVQRAEICLGANC